MLTWLRLNQDALELPSLTQGTREQWFEAGWTALLDVTAHHPEKDAYLRQIGQHYGQHSKKTGAQKTSRQQHAKAICEQESKQLRQSFKNLTAHVQKSTD